jgi:hypothetical protein
MGWLERWDRHNQAVMDRHRRLPEPSWTRLSIVYVSLTLMWIVARVVPSAWVGAIAWLVIAGVTTVGLVRLRRREPRRGSSAESSDEPPGSTSRG